jgi:GntR family transcriptional regulator, transcriptional repressor for pyruvate dehydrogenase complex
VDPTDRLRGVAGGASTRVAEAVASDLRQRILSNSLDPGPLPRQEALCTEYGVSGPSMREALRILEAEGFITVRRGKFGGAYVHRPDWSSAAFAVGISLQGQSITLGDLAAAVLMLEPMCVAACADRTDRLESVVPALRANLEETDKEIGHGIRFSQAARAFHDLYVDYTPNQSLRLLVRSIVAIWSVQEQTWASALQRHSAYPAESEQIKALNAHRKVVTLIEEGEADKAMAFAAAHLKATQRMVLGDGRDRQVVDASSLSAVQYFRALRPDSGREPPRPTSERDRPRDSVVAPTATHVLFLAPN